MIKTIIQQAQPPFPYLINSTLKWPNWLNLVLYKEDPFALRGLALQAVVSQSTTARVILMQHKVSSLNLAIM